MEKRMKEKLMASKRKIKYCSSATGSRTTRKPQQQQADYRGKPCKKTCRWSKGKFLATIDRNAARARDSSLESGDSEMSFEENKWAVVENGGGAVEQTGNKFI